MHRYLVDTIQYRIGLLLVKRRSIILYVAQYNKADVKRLIPGEPKCEGVIYKESCSIRTHLKHIFLFQKPNQTHVHLSALRF